MLQKYLLAPLAALLLLAVAPRLAQAQTGAVGIGTTAPDASAALDIVASDKGALLPRLTATQVAAIASPATGLLVFQTDGLAGFYYNGGTPAAPSWQQMTTATGTPLTFSNGLTQTGSAIGLGGTLTRATTIGLAGYTFGLTGGNVGIGTATPGAGLQVSTAEKPSISNAAGIFLSGGASGNPNIELRGTNGAAYLDFVNDLSSDYAARILSTSSGLGFYTGGTNSPRLLLSSTGTLLLSSLAGSGTRLVVADASGNLATQAVPSGDNLGNHTATTNIGLNGNWLSNAPGNANGLRVDNVGNVGVGVPSPTQRLDVEGGILARSQSPISNQGAYLQWNRTGGAGETWLLNQQGGGGGGIRFGAATTGNAVTEWARFEGDGRLGLGTTSPAATAALDISSTSKGFLPPRLTLTQRDAIGSPAPGLTIYNTTTGKLNTWNGTAWDAALSATEQSITYAAVTFGYTGSPQTYTVPLGVTSLQVDAAGASGGSDPKYNVGGKGARVQATLTVVPGQVLNLYVGGAGAYRSANLPVSGGYNGGGDANHGAGGGATDVRSSGGQLTDRLLVAGGGGGGGNDGAYGTQGGAGGDPLGGNGTAGVCCHPQDSALGGTQAAGGASVGGFGTNGSLGTGGSVSCCPGGGGGGGYYGGGGGSVGGGGGGSSWVTPTGSRAVAMTAGANTGNGSLTLTPNVVYAAPTLSGSNFTSVASANGLLARGADFTSQQGAYLQWNRTGSQGETWLLNQQGGGPGGIYFGKADQSNNTTEWARFDSNGNLGLGTTSPGHPLTVQAGAGSNSPLLGFYSPAGADKYNFSLAGGGLNLSESGVAGGRLFVQDGGNVGIGTTSPIARLHVSGSASATPTGGNTSYFSGGSVLIGPQPPGGTTARATAAYFDGGQVWVNNTIVAGALNTTSDRRIKRVIGLSDRAADLALLNRLRITDYTYIDQHANTGQVVKKVIAQEVEEVLPAAVSRSSQAIPNVYDKATRLSYAQGQLTVATAKAHELPASGGRMRFYTPANEALDVAVTVVDAHTVRFASAEAYAGGLFVYGKYVDDFRSVDYDALTTLNVSATQELARKVEALEKQNAALQAKADAADAKAAQATATLETFEARLRRLEAGTGGQAQR